MKASSILIAVIAAIFSARSTPRSKSDHVTLIDVDSGKLLLAIAKSQWGGILGPHGYVGLSALDTGPRLKEAAPCSQIRIFKTIPRTSDVSEP